MEKLNNELLKEPEGEKEEKSPKRNSKDELIHKIVELSKNNEIKLPDTKLRRLTKQQLNELLASTVRAGDPSKVQTGCCGQRDRSRRLADDT